MLHSLVRVSRRVGCGHPGTNDCGARCDRPTLRRANRSPTLQAVKVSDALRRAGAQPREACAAACERLAIKTLLSRPRNADDAGL